MPKIRERYNKIIDFIAGKEKGLSQAAKLITLAGISGLSDIKYIRPELHSLLNPEEVAKMAAEKMALIEDESRSIEDISLYDDIQRSIIANIPKEFERSVSTQPKYREFFQKININPDDPVRSLNPENFQTQIFHFIRSIYPEIYIELSKKGKTQGERRKNTVDVLSKFILIEIFAGIEIPDYEGAPREFAKKMPGIINGVKAMLSDEMFTRLSNEYRKGDVEEAAKTLISMKEIVKSSNFKRSKSRSKSRSATSHTPSGKESAKNVNSAAKILAMLRGNTRNSAKTTKERTRKRRRTGSTQRSAGHSHRRRSSNV